MKVVIQRVKSANVEVGGKIVGEIEYGLLIYIGIKVGDTQLDADFLAEKIVNMRIINDENGKLNLSIKDIKGQIMAISNFTLYGNAQKGNRPDFICAQKYDKSQELYEYICNALIDKGIKVAKGVFGADMTISSVCDGPVTIILHSAND
ncbi:MAG: D-aminoacyl-tRNA deacylase [Clostridia bacterium]